MGLRFGGIRLVTHEANPWAKLWHCKYDEGWEKHELIRFVEEKWGSHIWNSTQKGQSLIQENSFWEVRNGESTLFWEDVWQQLPKLEDTLNTLYLI